MKIVDLEVNKSYTITLAVLSATARETRAKKPYLAVELFDGQVSIAGNYWEWGGKNIPAKNSIVDVTAQVTEWQGAKQLNIRGMSQNTTLTLADFTPESSNDIGTIYKEAYSLASTLNNDFLRSLCEECLEDLQEHWCVVPGAKTVHHAYLAGTLIHSYSVAQIALSMSLQIEGANIDLAVAGGLLHDIGKLFGYKIDGLVCDLTDEGMLHEHSFLGASYISSKGSDLIRSEADKNTLELLRHIILSHHGKQEYGAAVPPMCIEAHIVHHADAIDAAAEQIRVASAKANGAKFTERLWALANVPHLTTTYVEACLSN